MPSSYRMANRATAGAFAAWSRFMKWPKFSPLLLPPEPSTIAISIGEPIDAARYASMKCEAMLDDLFRAIVVQHADAVPCGGSEAGLLRERDADARHLPLANDW